MVKCGKLLAAVEQLHEKLVAELSKVESTEYLKEAVPPAKLLDVVESRDLLGFTVQKLKLVVAGPDVPCCSWPETAASTQNDLDKGHVSWDMLQAYLRYATPPEERVAEPGATGSEALNPPPPDGAQVEGEDIQ